MEENNLKISLALYIRLELSFFSSFCHLAMALRSIVHLYVSLFRIAELRVITVLNWRL